MQVITYSEKGINKKENEDRILVCEKVVSNGLFSCSFKKGVIALADGVGGNLGGAFAANYVLEMLSKEMNITKEKLDKINDDLIEISLNNPKLTNMATTLTAITIDEVVKLVHVGNTRLYALTNRGYLKQITIDDTTVQFLLSIRQLDEEEAKTFSRRNEITACLGGGKKEYFKPKFSEFKNIYQGLLLTCDGIHDYLTIDEMEEIIGFKQADYQESLKQLVKKARENGSFDDASVIYIY